MTGRSSLFVCALFACARVEPGESDSPEEAANEPQVPLAIEFDYPEVPVGATVEPPVAVRTPNPRPELLAATKTAMFDKPRHLVARVRFCVAPDGTVGEVRNVDTTEDEQLREILRETVKRWKFQPARHEGRPTTACGFAAFTMRFS